jgi:hypothetical protein
MSSSKVNNTRLEHSPCKFDECLPGSEEITNNGHNLIAEFGY